MAKIWLLTPSSSLLKAHTLAERCGRPHSVFPGFTNLRVFASVKLTIQGQIPRVISILNLKISQGR